MPPATMWNKIHSMFVKEPEVPHLELLHAVLLSILYTISYVGVLYLHPSTRPTSTLSRNDPTVIRMRVRAVYTSTFISTMTTFFVLRSYGGKDTRGALKTMGVLPGSGAVWDVIKGVALTMVLFAGPLVERFCFNGDLAGWQTRVPASLTGWFGWRNYVVGPVTEEIAFRSSILSLHLITPHPTATTLIFATPLYFGLAHLHHFYEFTLQNPDSKLMGLVRSVVQFTYTTLFGWYASWLYLRFGNLWVAILAHSFCNLMGVPTFYGRIDDGGQRWKTGVYYATLVAGTVGFFKLLWVWTESGNALIAI